MKIKFWGVRGSLPCPGLKTVKYGGNTSCIEVITDLDYKIIIDCGTGIRPLGDDLIANNKQNAPMDIYIFITHTHWDHIMGFPFFKPIYFPNVKIHIYGPKIKGTSMEKAIGGQMAFPFFPVNYKDLLAKIDYNELTPGQMILPGGVKVSYDYLNHPLPTLGYRVDYNGKSVATCYDHEPFSNLLSESGKSTKKNITPQELNNEFTTLYQNVDLLIHDAQYTSKEYESSFVGWGHSPYEEALEKAVLSHAKKLIFFHHDTTRTDDMLDRVNAIYSKMGKKHNIEAHPAIEESEIIL